MIEKAKDKHVTRSIGNYSLWAVVPPVVGLLLYGTLSIILGARPMGINCKEAKYLTASVDKGHVVVSTVFNIFPVLCVPLYYFVRLLVQGIQSKSVDWPNFWQKYYISTFYTLQASAGFFISESYNNINQRASPGMLRIQGVSAVAVKCKNNAHSDGYGGLIIDNACPSFDQCKTEYTSPFVRFFCGLLKKYTCYRSQHSAASVEMGLYSALFSFILIHAWTSKNVTKHYKYNVTIMVLLCYWLLSQFLYYNSRYFITQLLNGTVISLLMAMYYAQMYTFLFNSFLAVTRPVRNVVQ
jgi:hypothetical protein